MEQIKCYKHKLKVVCSFQSKIVHIKDDIFSYNNARFNLALLFSLQSDLERDTLRYIIFTEDNELSQYYKLIEKQQVGSGYHIRYNIEFFVPDNYSFNKNGNSLYCPFLLKYDLSEILPVTRQEISYSIEEKLLFTKPIVYAKDIKILEVPIIKKEIEPVKHMELPQARVINNNTHPVIEETINSEEEDEDSDDEDYFDEDQEIEKMSESDKVDFSEIFPKEEVTKKWEDAKIQDQKDITRNKIEELRNEYYELRERKLSKTITPEEEIIMHNLEAFIIPMQMKEFYKEYNIKLPDYATFVINE